MHIQTKPLPQTTRRVKDLSVKEYSCTPTEKEAVRELKKLWFHYNLLKHTCCEKNIELFFNFQQYILTCTTSATPKEQKSNIVYIDITNEPADDCETIFKVLSSLKSQYQEICGISEYLPVVGGHKDIQPSGWAEALVWTGTIMVTATARRLAYFKKTFNRCCLRHTMILVWNRAEKCGFHQSTLTALSQCSNFRTTHNFLMQICEAIFQHTLTCFMKHRNGHTLLQNFPSKLFPVQSYCECNSRHSRRHKQWLYP